MNNILIKNSLHTLPSDTRDLTVGGIYKLLDINEIPKEDFIIDTNFIVKDQGDSDLCSAFATTSASELQEEIELSPEYQFALIKLLSNSKVDEWGADLRQACNSFVDVGSLPQYLSPFSLKLNNRDFVSDHSNWKKIEDNNIQEIKSHAKKSYLKVIGGITHFNSIRIALWQFKDEKRAIVVGAKWRNSWSNAKNGIIEDIDYSNEDGFGHAFIFIGQKIINNKVYLIAQLSNGYDFGNKGLFYFPENIVNNEMKRYGAFMFCDISKQDAKFYQNSDVFIGDSKVKILLYKLIKKICSIF